MYVGGEITRAIGQPVIRLFKALPPVFAIICVGGVALGVFLTSSPSIDQEKGRVFIRGLGVLIICFYVGALVLWSVKMYRHTWTAFCDWWLSVLDAI